MTHRLSPALRALALILALLGAGAAPATGSGARPTYLPLVSAPLWAPRPGASWQWQLSSPVDPAIPADIYDIDLFDTSAAAVADLHGRGRRAICYLSAGTVEDWRPDAGQFPALVVGRPYDGWPGERWLDIRRIDLIGPIMAARLDQCRAKGFDAVEPDNLDGYAAATGFPLTAADQKAYLGWLAAEAHRRGLSIGLKNVPELAAELAPLFDWALTEDCFDQGWCEELRPFLDRGKAVLAAEYTDTGASTAVFCPQARRLGISAILKRRALDAWIEPCP